MSWKKCSSCGASFNGGMFESTCSACRRQGQLVGVMREQVDAASAAAETLAQAAQLEASAAMHAADAQHRLADAAQTESAGRARQAELEGKATYATAVGAMDDAGLRRLHADEQLGADRDASQQIVDDVAAAVGCIEAGGTHTPRIDSQAGREAQAYLHKGGKLVDGVGGAFRWHNLVACERLLIGARESLPKITHFAAAISREELEWKINQALPTVKPLRKDAATSAVEDIGRNRAIGYGSCIAVACVALGVAAATTEIWGAIAVLPVVFCGAGALGVNEWDKAKPPIHFEDMRREAESGSKSGRVAWLIAGSLSIAGILLGGLSLAFRSHVENEKPRLAGDYSRDSQTLRVEPGWLVLNKKQRLPLGSADVQESTHGTFEGAVLATGVVFDDTCSGSLDRNGNQLVVTINEGSANDCTAFAGEWIVNPTSASPSAPSAAANPGPKSVCDVVAGRWTAEINADTGSNWGHGNNSKLIVVEGRTIKLWTTVRGMTPGVGWTGWNTQAPTEEAGTCVFVTRDAIQGEGFDRDNPYAVVTKIRLKPADKGIELTMDTDDFAALPCTEKNSNCTKDHKQDPGYTSAVKGWLRALNGSFWKPAAPIPDNGLGDP